MANRNSKALNVIFNVVDTNKFKLMSTCKTTKEAREILETAREGTNEAFALRQKYSKEKLKRKALRSLNKRFAYKVTAIEEAKDVQTMKLEELGSL